MPFVVQFRKNWYLPAPAVTPKSPVDFKLVSKHVSEWGAVKLSFEAKGKLEEVNLCGGMSYRAFRRLGKKVKMVQIKGDVLLIRFLFKRLCNKSFGDLLLTCSP